MVVPREVTVASTATGLAVQLLQGRQGGQRSQWQPERLLASRAESREPSPPAAPQVRGAFLRFFVSLLRDLQKAVPQASRSISRRSLRDLRKAVPQATCRCRRVCGSLLPPLPRPTPRRRCRNWLLLLMPAAGIAESQE